MQFGLVLLLFLNIFQRSLQGVFFEDAGKVVTAGKA